MPKPWLIVVLLLALAVGPAMAQKKPLAQRSATDSVDAHLGRAYAALKDEKSQVAVGEFRAALKLDPSLTLRARFPLAVALFEMQKYKDARREFEAVRRDAGDHSNVQYYIGRIELEDQDFDGAVKNLSQAVDEPPLPDTAYYLGLACFKQGNLAEAEKWLKKAAEVTPRDPVVQYQLGLVYRKLGQEEDAKHAIALSGEQRQRNSDQMQLRTECAQRLDHGPREEAHTLCDRLYDPDDADGLAKLGTIYGQHGDLEAALKPLSRAAALEPRSPQMQYNLAFAYYRLNQYEKARDPLRDAIARWPDVFQLAALYGAVLAKLGEDDAAHENLQHAHALNPQDGATSDLLYLTALALARKAQADLHYEDALRHFEEAAALKAQEPAPHRGLAEIDTLTGHDTEAEAEQRKADRLALSIEKPK